MRFQLHDEKFFKLGLLQCRHPLARIQRTCHQTNMDRFKDAYYVCPKTAYDVYCDIQKEEMVGDKRIKNPKPTKVLLALRFLKKYPTAHDLAGIGRVTEKTALVQCWRYIEAIQALKKKKVSRLNTYRQQNNVFFLFLTPLVCRLYGSLTI